LAALLLALVLVAVSCGGDDGGGSSGEEDSSAVSSEEQEAEEGQVVVDEDFDDDENLWSPDELDIDGEQDLGIEDGALVTEWQSDVVATLPEGQSLVPNLVWPSVIDGLAEDLTDVRVEAEVSFGSPGVAGLSCRIADVAPDATDFRAYWFQLGATGQINLAETDEAGTFDALEIIPELDEDERDEVDELPLEGAVFDFEDGQTYELALSCVDGEDGVELTGAIDGEEVISAVDDEDPIESGAAALVSSQSSLATAVDGFEEFEVRYDSYTLTNLGDEIDEEDIETAAEDAEEAGSEEPTDDTDVDEPAGPSGETGVLGIATDPSAIADAGSDPALDGLAEDCFAGTFAACDQLFLEAPAGGAYAEYGASCGGRLEVGIDGDCDDAAQFASQPGTTAAADLAEFGSDPVFDELALACEAGDLEACDALYLQTPVGSEMEAFGSTCGARGETEYAGNCIGDGG